jgi:hypothetical protein
MILTPAKQSLQARLNEFGERFMGGVFVSKQAFSKQRQFVDPEYIREYYDESVDILMAEGELRTYKGMHVTAVDGSCIACENTPNLIESFGCSGSKKDACTALASVAYDVIEHVTYDCQIAPYGSGERKLLDKHLNRLEAFRGEKFLIIADRGYPSYILLEDLIEREFYFLLRISDNWRNVISWLHDRNERELDYENKGKTYSFRAIKIEIGEKFEYLITNLDDSLLSLEDAKYLYSLRWDVETFFSFAKTELELENFSGKTEVAVLQEFYATMFLANLCLCFINDADSNIAKENEHKDLKYEYKANRRLSIGQIVPVFLECLLTDNKRKRDRLWKKVERFCASFSQPIRPDRNPKRKTPRDKKFYSNARKPGLS